MPYLGILGNSPSNLSKCKVSYKTNYLTYLCIFRLKFEKTVIIFEISTNGQTAKFHEKQKKKFGPKCPIWVFWG